jgi:hypothetical protein
MVDFSQLLGGDPGGLLTPEQAGGVNQNFLQAIGAGLMKASGPSPYKAGMTAFSGLGEALQGGLAARRQAQVDAMNQTVARAKMLEGLGPLLKQQAYAHSFGQSLPPEQQHLLDSLLGTVMGRTGAASRAAGMPMTPGGAPGASGVPGTGPRAEGAPSQATGAIPEAVDGIKTNFLFNLAKEYNLDPLAVVDKEHPSHDFIMGVAKQRATDTDRVHQQTLTDQLSQQKEMDDLGKRVRELRDLGKLTPENLKPIVDRMREIGVDESIIKRLATGAAAAPEAKPVQTISVGRGTAVPGAAAAPVMPPAGTLPPNMASMLGGIGTPPAPSPAGAPSGLPAAPAPVTPPGPPPEPPVSPLRTGAASTPFLPPPAGTMPPLNLKPPAPPPVAPPAAPPTAVPKPEPAAALPPGMAPLGETRAQQLARLGIKPEVMLSGHPDRPAAEKLIESDIAEQAQYRTKAQEAELARETARQGKLTDRRIKFDEQMWGPLVSLGQSASRAMEDNALSRDLLARDVFTTGITGPGAETWAKLKAAFGWDPNAAFEPEVFKKINMQGVLNQLTTMKAESTQIGPGGGKVLNQEYNTITQAIQNIGNGKASNIFLSHLSDNIARQNKDLLAMAIEYKKNSKDGLLDEGYVAKMIDYLERNPAYDKGLLAQARAEGAAASKPAPKITSTEPKDLKPGISIRNRHNEKGEIIGQDLWSGKEWAPNPNWSKP